MKFFTLSFLSMAISLTAIAADVQNLQQRASFAYEEMERAKREAKRAAEESAAVQKRLHIAKQELTEAEREARIAQQKSAKAQAAAEQAERNWNNASTLLEREWRRTK